MRYRPGLCPEPLWRSTRCSPDPRSRLGKGNTSPSHILGAMPEIFLSRPPLKTTFYTIQGGRSKNIFSKMFDHPGLKKCRRPRYTEQSLAYKQTDKYIAQLWQRDHVKLFDERPVLFAKSQNCIFEPAIEASGAI